MTDIELSTFFTKTTIGLDQAQQLSGLSSFLGGALELGLVEVVVGAVVGE